MEDVLSEPQTMHLMRRHCHSVWQHVLHKGSGHVTALSCSFPIMYQLYVCFLNYSIPA